MASSTSEGPLEELLAPVVARSGLELDSVTRSRSDAMPLLRVVVEAPIGADGIDSDTLAELTKVGHWLRQIGRLVRIKLRAGGYVSGRVVAANEISATIDVDGETTTIDYSDMRKARSRVDFGTGN